MNFKKLVMLCGLLFCFFAVLLSTPAHAASNGTLTVHPYNLNGSYKVELFQVGAPYPSRVTNVSICGGTQFTWYNLVTTQQYFVRVTDTKTGQARQSGAFWFLINNPADLYLNWTGGTFAYYYNLIH